MIEVNYNTVPEALSYLIKEVSLLKSLVQNQSEGEPKIYNNKVLTRKEVKENYKISYGTLHNLMKAKKLPYSKIGRRTLFDSKQVESFFMKSNNL